jgi:hypothetical protein
MRKNLKLGMLVAFLLAVVSLPAAAAPSDTRSGDKKVEVIRLTSITVEDVDLDLGEPGDSLGDQNIHTGDLFRGGEKVGILGVVCTTVRADADAFSFLCVGSAELPKGQITIQGLITFTETAEEPFEIAVTGGTGKYRTAHGVLSIRQIGLPEEHLTFKIIR